MFFSFPTSFLCFSWNSFAASSCSQRPGDRVGQRQAEDEAQKKGRGQNVNVTSTHARHQQQLLPKTQEYKMCIRKSPKGRTRSCQQLLPESVHAHMHAMGLAHGRRRELARAPPTEPRPAGVRAGHPSSRGKGAGPAAPGLQRERTSSSLRVFTVGSITTSFTAAICSSMARSCTSLNSCKTTGGSGR